MLSVYHSQKNQIRDTRKNKAITSVARPEAVVLTCLTLNRTTGDFFTELILPRMMELHVVHLEVTELPH